MSDRPKPKRPGSRWAVLLLAALAACGSATDSQGPRLASGKWLYRGVVGPCEITGVLTISAAGSTLTGRMPTAGSACGRSSGYFQLIPDSSVAIAGQIEGDSAVFTLSGWGSQLRHSAALQGDSLSGSISTPGSSWLQGPGTFSARRYDETPQGRFRLVISGAMNDTVEGRSYANQYGIWMNRDDDLVHMELVEQMNVTQYPDITGTWSLHAYQATQDSLSGWMYLPKTNRIFNLSGGTLTITSVSGGFIRGTFEVHAFDKQNPASTVTIRGDFYPHRDPDAQ